MTPTMWLCAGMLSLSLKIRSPLLGILGLILPGAEKHVICYLIFFAKYITTRSVNNNGNGVQSGVVDVRWEELKTAEKSTYLHKHTIYWSYNECFGPVHRKRQKTEAENINVLYCLLYCFLKCLYSMWVFRQEDSSCFQFFTSDSKTGNRSLAL